MSYETAAHGAFVNADVDTIEELATINTRAAEFLFVTFVVGTANLSDFLVEARVHPSGGWAVVATATGDFTTPVHPVIKASSDLNAAASGATVHWLKLDVAAFYEVRLSAAGTSSTVTGNWGVQ